MRYRNAYVRPDDSRQEDREERAEEAEVGAPADEATGDAEAEADEPTAHADDDAARSAARGDEREYDESQDPSAKRPRNDSLSIARSPAAQVRGFPMPGHGISVQANANYVKDHADSVIDQRIAALIMRGCDILELYSPERVTKACERHGLVPGPALDLRSGYDFTKESDRRRAMAIYEKSQPELVV